MSGRDIARQWFVPGEGIDRHVISADIQRYLGNDATVRPGRGTNENAGVEGYWIKAYRNLTSAMVADLRADSARWRQEQRSTGTRDSYVGSNTHHQSTSARPPRRDGDSPRAEHGIPPRERASASRLPTERMDHRMDMDVPAPRQNMPFPPERGYPQDNRPIYSPDGRPPYQSEAMPPTSGYPGRSLAASASPYGPPPTDFPPNYPPSTHPGSAGGFPRQDGYYLSTPGFEPPPNMPARAEPPYGMNSYNGPPGTAGREPPRYGQQEYADPRYAYPSPAATVSSVSARDREVPPGASQQPPRFPTAGGAPSFDRADNDSGYGQMPTGPYDQFGRPTTSFSQSSQSPTTTAANRISGGVRRASVVIDPREAQRRRI